MVRNQNFGSLFENILYFKLKLLMSFKNSYYFSVDSFIPNVLMILTGKNCVFVFSVRKWLPAYL